VKSEIWVDDLGTTFVGGCWRVSKSRYPVYANERRIKLTEGDAIYQIVLAANLPIVGEGQKQTLGGIKVEILRRTTKLMIEHL
jgi:hypothetical protein